MTALTEDERVTLWRWWNSDWPRNGVDVMDVLFTEVETILAARMARSLAHMEALAAEADAGGDHATAARIRTALWGEDTDDGEGE